MSNFYHSAENSFVTSRDQNVFRKMQVMLQRMIDFIKQFTAIKVWHT